MHPSLEDFLQFSEIKQGHLNNIDVLKMLYEYYLNHLIRIEKPVLTALGGSAGSGKTTLRKSFQLKNTHLHDMDDVMVRLPDYQIDLNLLGAKKAFDKWWPYARKLAGLLVNYAIEASYSIFYDRTCGAESSYDDLVHAKKRGYYVTLTGLYVDLDIARARIAQREIEEGRAITENNLKEYRARFSALWPHYLALVDKATLYQTNSRSPILVYSSEEGILDHKIYQEFLKEGEVFNLNMTF